MDSYLSDYSPAKRIPVDSTLLKAPGHDSRHNILHKLNDDCLNMIFEHLTFVDDLYTVSNVCRRFEHIVLNLAKRRYIRHPFVLPGYFNQSSEPVSLQHTESYLLRFASCIRSIIINSLDVNSTLAMIAMHCPHVEELEFTNFAHVDASTWIDFLPLLQRLRKLSTSIVPFILFKKSMPILNELKTLHVHLSDQSMDAIMDVQCPCLVELSLAFGEVSTETFSRFLLETNSIKVLKLSNCKIAPTILNAIPACLPLVQKVSFESIQFTSTEEWPAISWANLSCLKELELVNVNEQSLQAFPFESLAERDVHVECLRLEHIRSMPSHTFDDIWRIKSLTHIELIDCQPAITDEHLMQIATELPCLQKIRVQSDYVSIAGIRRITHFIRRATFDALVVEGKKRSRCPAIEMDDCDEIAQALGKRISVELLVRDLVSVNYEETELISRGNLLLQMILRRRKSSEIGGIARIGKNSKT